MSKICWAEQIIHFLTLNAYVVSLSKQVEIHPGTGVMVERLAWAYALNANSASVFVRHLLTAVFPVEVLLVSNLRGNKRGRGDARLPLDKNKLDAIYSTFSAFNGHLFVILSHLRFNRCFPNSLLLCVS